MTRLSGIKVRPKYRPCEVTMFIVTPGAGKQQVKAGRLRVRDRQSSIIQK
jgi:hypothetical protein